MSILFNDQSLSFEAGETVLDCLLRSGVSVPNSCRSGVCQSCLVTLKEGSADHKAVSGLSRAQRKASLILSCQQSCQPGLHVGDAALGEPTLAQVEKVEQLAGDIYAITLVPSAEFGFEAGQFVHVIRPADGVFRAYSCANLPGSGRILLQVRLMQNGELSPWLKESQGKQVLVRGPFGACTYVPEEPEVPLVLAGVGTGAAPLLGVIEQALLAGHRGTIVALFGARSSEDLYMMDQARGWNDRVDVRYSVLSKAEGAPPHVSQEPLPTLVKHAVTSVLGTSHRPWVYLCGDPGLVHKMKRETFLAGVPLDRILSDPFAPPASA